MHDSVKHFLAMGGYGLYVWLAYGAGLLVVLINTCIPYLNYRKMLKNQIGKSPSSCAQNVSNV